MPIATNPETGETVYLDNSGQWKPAPTAVHPESKQELVFDGSSWAPLAGTALGRGPTMAVPHDQPAAPPRLSATESFGRGFTGAGSFGFRDELAGLAAAGGAAPNEQDPAATLAALARGGYRRLTGDPEAERRYNAQVDLQRLQTRMAEAEHPGASLAGGVAGAVAMPLPALRAATVGGRALQAAGIGAATGALSGLGEAEGTLAERLPHGVTGAAIGGAVGGVAAPVLEGGIAAGRYLARPAEYIRSAIAPGATAERRIGRAYAEAAAADPAAISRLAPGELGAGRPGMVMDVLGEPGRTLARSAANLSDTARDTLNRAIDPRAEAQGDRFTTWVRGWMNHPDAHAAQEAIDLAERTGNRKNYADAMAQGNFPIETPLLERLMDAAPVQRAMSNAAEALQTRAISEGRTAPKIRNLEFWDATRKQVSDAANAARRAGRTEEASVLGNLARTLNTELDTQVPTYAVARQGAANYFGAENALEAGQKFVNQNYNTAQTRALLNKMSPSELDLFRDGFASRMIETIERLPDRADVTRKVWGNQARREQIDLVLGKQRADQLEAMSRVENIMRESQRAVQGNSTTARQLIQAGAAGAAGGYYSGYDPTTSGLGTALLVFGKGKLDQRVASKIASMLVSSDPKVVDRGVKMIAQNERFMSVLREADAAVGRVAGSQSGKRAQ